MLPGPRIRVYPGHSPGGPPHLPAAQACGGSGSWHVRANGSQGPAGLGPPGEQALEGPQSFTSSLHRCVEKENEWGNSQHFDNYA